jgi:hypothetical protein
VGSAGAIGLSVAAFAWMVTDGTWNFLQTGVVSDFYDAQARALLHGHWYVPANVASIEGIVEHHRTYLYYGPVPALLRMPVLLLTQRLDGRLTELSMLVAFTAALIFVARLSWRIRVLVAGHGAVSIGEALVGAAVVLAVGIGSQFWYLGSDAVVYHEAEIWGAALALGAFDFLVGFIVKPSLRAGVLAGTFSTLAILTRGSVGAGPVAALGLLALAHGVVAVRRRLTKDPTTPRRETLDWLGLGPGERTWTVLLAVCVIVPVGLYIAVNEAKFGTVVSLPLNKQVMTTLSPHRRAVLASNGGGYFSASYIPTALLQYLRPDALNIGRLAPFFGFPGPATVVSHVVYDDRDFASSLTATMPAFALASVVGLLAIFGRRHPHSRSRRLAALRVPVLGAAVGTVGVLTIAFIANRYLADFMPVLVLTTLAGVHVLISVLRRMRWPAKAAVTVVAAAAALFGVLVNTSLALTYQRVLRPGVPIAQRASYLTWQEGVDAALFGGRPPGIERVAKLGAPTKAGDLAIVGHCTALYQSSGSGWNAVERSQAAGHYRLLVTFPSNGPHGYWPLLVNGIPHGTSYLAVQEVAAHRYRIGYRFEGFGTGWITGPSFEADAGRPYVVDAALDSAVRDVSVEVNGAVVFEVGFVVRGDRPIYTGRNPLGGPALPHFPGTLRVAKVTTPICDALLRRMGG